jgi:hypothetical protein
MKTQNQEDIILHKANNIVLSRDVFYQMMDKINNDGLNAGQLSEEFGYSRQHIYEIRKVGIKEGLIKQSPTVLKMLETRKTNNKPRAKKAKKTLIVDKQIQFISPQEKETPANSKFVNIKFGEIEVIVEKSANIVITKEKIVIN